MKLRYVLILVAVLVPVTWLWSAAVAVRDAQLFAVLERQAHIERCAAQDAIPVRIYSPNRTPAQDPVVCKSGSMRTHKRSMG